MYTAMVHISIYLCMYACMSALMLEPTVDLPPSIRLKADDVCLSPADSSPFDRLKTLSVIVCITQCATQASLHVWALTFFTQKFGLSPISYSVAYTASSIRRFCFWTLVTSPWEQRSKTSLKNCIPFFFFLKWLHLYFYYFLTYCACMWCLWCIPYMVVEVNGYLVRVHNLFPSCEFCGLNSVY